VCLLATVMYPFATASRLGWVYKGPALRESRPGEPSVRAGTKGDAMDPDQLAKDVLEESIHMGVILPTKAAPPA